MNQVAFDRVENDVLLIRLAGRWELRKGLASAGALEAELRREAPPSRVTFDTHQLGHWDSSILAFLSRVSEACRERGVALDGGGLPAGLDNLLDLAQGVAEPAGAQEHFRHPARVRR